MADHYEVLQVHPTADPEVIRSAFRALARKFHPDFGGDQRTMMAINEAWSVLGDRRRRAAYDVARNAGRQPRGQYTASGRYEWTPQQAPDRPASQPAPTPESGPAGPIAAAAGRRAEGHGGPASGHGTGPVLDFGRYAGWSVSAVAQHDPDYLLWLERTPVGRRYGPDIRQAIERRSSPVATATAAMTRQSLLRRRAR